MPQPPGSPTAPEPERGPIRRLFGRAFGRRPSPDPTAVRAVPPNAVIIVTYEPSIDGDPDPGEVIWGWVPYEDDPTRGKDRPMVVIGRCEGRLVGVPLTSRQRRRDMQVSVGAGTWDGQRRESYARVDHAIEMATGTYRREGAVLQRDRFDAVVAGVGRYRHVQRS